jgi:hypothetical protein
MGRQEVVPYEGLGNIRFGTPRAAIRALLKVDFTSFIKGDDHVPTDAYDTLGMHLYFDEQDCLEFIEAFPPCNPVYRDIRLLSMDVGIVLHALAALGHASVYAEAGYTFADLGIVLFVPESAIEAVSLYRRGYYNHVV